MAGEGDSLRQAREQLGWSLLKAEEETKIRVRYLKALEDEEYSVLPGSTYVKGFLRTYAKHLGLNPDEIVNKFKPITSASDDVLGTPLVTPTAFPLEPIKMKPVWLRPVIAAAMACLAIVLVIGIAHFSREQNKSTASNFSTPPLPSPPQVETQVPDSAINTNQNPNSPSVIAATTDTLTANIVFTEPCWVDVEADGQKVLQGTYLAGVTKEIKANEQITLVTVGNAGGLTITINGKPQPSLGKSSQVVKDIRYTKEIINQ